MRLPRVLHAAAVAASVAALAVAALVLPASPGAAGVLDSQRIIVTLVDGSDARAVVADHLGRFGGEVHHVYEHALSGYAASLPSAALDAISADPRVAAVELDGIVRLVTTQSGATWGIDRSDQRSRPLSGTFTYTSTGSGVDAYIIDTGIRRSHAEFGGRARTGVDKIDGGEADDCNGHGTHVAGTTGGASYGIAKAVDLIAVRVFGCGSTGSTSTIIAGIDWVTGDHVAGQPAVANLSLGGGGSTALDNSVKALIADGVTAAVAAGNGNLLGQPIDACTVSPARVPEAVTIGASDSSDRKASFSNYGKCVDFHAPGVSITSAGISNDTSKASMSGTSMAAPHVAGVAAQYLATNPSATPATVASVLYDKTTKGIVSGTSGGLLGGGSTPNNHLLFTDF